jgi:hypothetical protein
MDTSKLISCLEQVQLHIERMDASAEQIPGDDGFVAGYKFKTGAWHTILGMARGGCLVDCIAKLRAGELARKEQNDE